MRKVSRELGVRYVLEGSVRRAASRVRINAQMIDGQTGGHLWAERYDRDLEDIFAVQDEVTRTIVTALKVELTAGRADASARRAARSAPKPTILSSAPAQTMMQLRPEAAIEARGMSASGGRARLRAGARVWRASRSSPSPSSPIAGTGRRRTISTRALELADKAIAADDERAAGPHRPGTGACLAPPPR